MQILDVDEDTITRLLAMVAKSDKWDAEFVSDAITVVRDLETGHEMIVDRWSGVFTAEDY